MTKTPKGAALKWLQERIGFDRDECLLWPFSRDSHGYGQVYFERKVRRASRLMCQLAHGEPPTSQHHAAHKCGKGHTGCVNPKHLEWKTASENQFDRRMHGTHNGGGRWKSTMTVADILYIRSARGKVTQKTLAEKYGVADATIRGIQTRRWFKHVS